MKGTHFRQMLCLLLALVLTGALFGCGKAVPASEEAAAVPGFFLTAEYDRLYYAPLDGSAPRLLVDNSTVCTVRTGEWLYASFEDGSVRRLSLDGSQMEELVPVGVHVYRQLIPYDGGFVGIWYSLRDGSGCDLYRDGSQTPVPFIAEISTALQPSCFPSCAVSILSPFFLTTSIILMASTTGIPSSVSCVVKYRLRSRFVPSMIFRMASGRSPIR